MMNIDHILNEKIDAYLTGTMTPEEKKEFSLQIKGNPELQSIVDFQARVIENVQELALAERLKKNQPTAKIQALRVRNQQLFVAIAATFGLFIAFFYLISDNSDLGEQITQTYYEKDPLATKRGKTNTKAVFKTGDDAYIEGDWPLARQNYMKIEKELPNDKELQYRIGLTYLAEKNGAKAISYFQEATSNSNNYLSKKAYWYLGFAYLQTKNYPKARIAFQKVALLPEDDIYTQNATKILEELKP